jgi:manganese/zinc/iron transport system substrate-binding protein
LVVLGCSREEAGRAPGDNLHVTATIGMITDVARNIGGEHVEVTGLMGPGVDPHLYKATQGDLDRLTDSDLILYNGLHLEGRMADVLVRMASRVPTVQVTEYIPEDRLREPPEFEGQYDPHVWFDVELWKYAAERIRDAFIEQDPAHEAAYRANAEAYLEKLDELDAYVRDRMASIPEKHRVLVTPHDAFGYFGAAYGLDVLALQGISTAAEYGLQDVDRLLDEIIERDIRAVFVESSISPKSIEALVEGAESRGHDLAVGGELFSDAMGEAGAPEGTYIGMVRHNTDAIAEALQ